jgi:hypothetical protein
MSESLTTSVANWYVRTKVNIIQVVPGSNLSSASPFFNSFFVLCNFCQSLEPIGGIESHFGPQLLAFTSFPVFIIHHIIRSDIFETKTKLNSMV